MNDVRINQMVRDLKDRLGFTSQQDKKDQIMKEIALGIYKKVMSNTEN